MKHYIFSIATLVCSFTLSGCFLFEQPEEEPLGAVHVDALLVSDTCGPGITTGEPTMSYDVEIRRSGDSIVWSGPAGTVQGTFSSDESFCIEQSSQWHVRDADPWYEDPGCDMVSIERLCGTLTLESVSDASEADSQEVTGLLGRHEAFISGTTGSNCSDQVGVAEGQYLDLPCQITYSLTGVQLQD